MIDKFILVGNSFSGKTSLLVTLNMREFPNNYLPCIEDTCSITHKGTQINFEDTPGANDYARFRTSSYTQNSFFLLCFSVNDTQSFLNIEQQWLREIRNSVPNAPIMLVGMKSDLVSKVSREDIEILQKKIKAPYIEISSLEGSNLNLLLDNLADRITMEPAMDALRALALEARQTSLAAKFGKFALPLSKKIPVAEIIESALMQSTTENMKIELDNLSQPKFQNNEYAQRTLAILAQHNIEPLVELAPASNLKNAKR